ncbi:ATPase associated with various cellular activities AAA_5 [Desulfofundulus kuznetsovii DSM 6115]|uniref:ATPase associated with various cellular activities AAA_5 n=1 Tax=Desulfofundulus kuznetsovii (strain DSM 6115 / VKM B-1805 / 17) TaxID=760568 RepID=A0AAU8P8H0_DESK7|nr:ATPase associated with various cellular activities AAA_5 [Desulfofundulus kuznetsovii DSM 6115]
MLLKIFPGNVEKALNEEHKPFLRGFGLGRDGKIYLEYLTHAGGKRQIIAAQTGADRRPIIYHECKSFEGDTPKPCWHLGAISLAMPGHPPMTVEVERYQVAPAPIVKDLTEDILGRPGDFELLELIEEDTLTEEAKEYVMPELPPEDAWLARYNLPVRVLKKVLGFRERQKQTLSEEQKSRVPEPRYIPSGNEFVNAVAALVYGPDGSAWEAPLLIGPKGSGKSTMAETLAAVMMLPVNKIFGGIDLNAEALLGSRTLVPADEGIDIVTEAKLRSACRTAGMDAEPLVQKLRSSQMKVGFEPGILLQAVEKGEMVIVDEINMLIPEVTSLLHGLLDWQKTLSVPGYGVVKAPPSFRLVGCMNYGYAGTKPLNEAFQDRFRSVQVPHLESERLADLIVQETGCKESVSRKLANLFSELAKGVANGDYSERVLSVRSLFRIAREEMDGCGTLKTVAISVLTEGLGDKFEIDQVTDIVEACLRD